MDSNLVITTVYKRRIYVSTFGGPGRAVFCGVLPPTLLPHPNWRPYKTVDKKRLRFLYCSLESSLLHRSSQKLKILALALSLSLSAAMYNGIMDPEMLRLAQEQMSRIPPQEFARIQQQMMSNPELMKLAAESMKNLTPEDVRRAADQLKQTRPEDMVEISEKMANATPEEIASMQARADAQITYELNAAQMLKKQGNEFHGHGQYHEAAKKYLLAKNNLIGIPESKCKTLKLQCSVNIMSCYLKTGQFEDCIKEGSEVLAYDPKNVKALYRRGQAYRELGNLEAAVSDLSKAHEVSPDDETIAAVLRDADEKLLKEGGSRNASRGLVIEEIVEEENQAMSSGGERSSSVEYVVHNESTQISHDSRDPTAVAESLESLRDNPEAIRSFQSYMSNTNPETLAALSGGGMSSDMIKMATDMIGKMEPGELQKMFEVASALDDNCPSIPSRNQNANASMSGTNFPGMTPEMMKMASDRIGKMSPDELQNMLKVASSMTGKGLNFPTPTANTNGDGSRTGSEMTPEMVKMATDSIGRMSPEELQNMLKTVSSLNGNGTSFPTISTDHSAGRSESSAQLSASAGCSSSGYPSAGETDSSGLSTNSRMGQSSSSFPAPVTDMEENMKNSMKDPAMRQMFTSMIKNMSPEMMANMSEQFGLKLSKEDAAKAQQVMSALSPDDLDRMMRWAERAQQGVETAKKTKNWLLGRPGMILAIVMLILAFILHQLGFIGG